MIPAYSPHARGGSERNFGTWQNRLPQELRLAGITTVEAGDRFLRDRYIGEFNACSPNRLMRKEQYFADAGGKI